MGSGAMGICLALKGYAMLARSGPGMFTQPLFGELLWDVLQDGPDGLSDYERDWQRTIGQAIAALVRASAICARSHARRSLALPVLPLHVHQGLGLSSFVVGLVTGS